MTNHGPGNKSDRAGLSGDVASDWIKSMSSGQGFGNAFRRRTKKAERMGKERERDKAATAAEYTKRRQQGNKEHKAAHASQKQM